MTVNVESPTWKAVEALAKARIADLQQELELRLDPVETQGIRGRIWELRELLDVGGRAKSIAREGQPAKPTPNDYA